MILHEVYAQWQWPTNIAKHVDEIIRNNSSVLNNMEL